LTHFAVFQSSSLRQQQLGANVGAVFPRVWGRLDLVRRPPEMIPKGR
jgi:hypothetical protein